MLVLLSQTLIVATILRPDMFVSHPAVAKASPNKEGDFLPRGLRVWLLVLAIAFGLWWGVFPAALTTTAGLTPQGVLASAWAQMRAAGLLTGWITLLLPMLMGGLLVRWRGRLFAGQEAWLAKAASIASLDWLIRLARTGLHYTALVVGFGAEIFDGAGQFGWVLLILLILWLFFR